MGMKKISVRWCVDLRFNDLSGIFLTAGYKRVTTNGNRKSTYPADVTRCPPVTLSLRFYGRRQEE